VRLSPDDGRSVCLERPRRSTRTNEALPQALPLVQTDLPVSKPSQKKRLAHLGDALAYMECSSRLELSDHWVVYATVEMGRVSKPEATAIIEK